MRVGIQVPGLPGYVTGKRIFGKDGAVESGKPRRMVWSKYLQEDKGVYAAMAARALSGSPQKRAVFDKWYENRSIMEQLRFDNYR
ncbi:MAG: hypothetical protein LBI42_14660 [Chitinispirillales bacterium]|jgi:hypothetical protein|nr:hypothetical protein [Chitinispirillales bacterium]